MKFYFSPDPLYESSSIRPQLAVSPSPTKQSISSSSPNILPYKFPKLSLKELKTNADLKKNNENPIGPKEPYKQNLIKDQKVAKINKPVEISDEDPENHENDPPSSEESENLSPLQEYAKYYRANPKSLPKKRKHEIAPSSPKIIGKQREVFKAFGNQISVYKQTKFVEECETSNFVQGKTNLLAEKKDPNERKNAPIVVEKPKIPYNATSVNKYTAKGAVESFERILRRAEDKKTEQSCGVEENPENNDNNIN